ncbi:MAG: hypothetical protein KatS3mg051_0629 [Anaerolineae bacterium]|nr:MAG: hypothetical protein KatS3mg051_0629 [Anaerolineae bacterium]
MNLQRALRWLALTASAVLLGAATVHLLTANAPAAPATRLIIPTLTVSPPDSSPSPDPPPALALIQGLKARRLVLLPLDGAGAPLEIDRGVQVWPLLPSPDGTRLLYASAGAVMVFDAMARRAMIVGELPAGGLLLTAQWSPVGDAVAYVVQTEQHAIASYAPADGSALPVELLRVPVGLALDVGWLPDGRPVVLNLGLGAAGGLQPYYHAYDPVARRLVALSADEAEQVLQPWAPWRSPDGTQQVYAMSTWQNARFRGACRSGPLGLADDSWLPAYALSREGARPLAFASEGLFMDWPTWLQDGRILFRAIADPACARGQSGLYIGRPGENPQRLVAVEPDPAPDDADIAPLGVVYAVDPAQTRLAWSENDSGMRRSRVCLMPLAGGTARTIYYTSPLLDDAQPFAYRDQEIILHLVWLG